MKRFKMTALIRDGVPKDKWKLAVEQEGGELEHYSEKLIPKEVGLMANYSFDSLLESGKDFAEGMWLVAKSLFHMAGWAVITIVEGVRWLWKGAFQHKKKEGKNGM